MFQAPKFLPPLSLMLNDLPANHPRHIAKHLGVSERTVWAWKAAEHAPRAAMLALFWETRWGRSLADAVAFNEAQVHRGLSQCLQREVNALRAQVEHLEAIGEFGAANAPSWSTR